MMTKITVDNPKQEAKKWLEENNVNDVGDIVFNNKGMVVGIYLRDNYSAIVVRPLTTEIDIGTGPGSALEFEWTIMNPL